MSSLTQKPGIKDRIRPSRTWIKVKNRKAPAATRAADGKPKKRVGKTTRGPQDR
jgi:hypothetical protein